MVIPHSLQPYRLLATRSRRRLLSISRDLTELLDNSSNDFLIFAEDTLLPAFKHNTHILILSSIRSNLS